MEHDYYPPMPFPDEREPVEIVAHRLSWAEEFEAIRSILLQALGDLAMAIDHIGSTAVPGLDAKDVIDIQVLVNDVDDARIQDAFEGLGFRLRPEPWNEVESYAGQMASKLVYAPPPSARRANVHVRSADSASARAAVLFRDFLRANPPERQRWARFKVGVTAEYPDLIAYGQRKQPAWLELMKSAEAWATRTSWAPEKP